MAHTPVLIMETRIITKDIREANIMTIIMAIAIMNTTMRIEIHILPCTWGDT